MMIPMFWRSATMIFFLTCSVVAFPSATQLTWVNTAEARPIPQRLPISPERLSLAGNGERAQTIQVIDSRLGP